jgi:hypothetical protein
MVARQMSRGDPAIPTLYVGEGQHVADTAYDR